MLEVYVEGQTEPVRFQKAQTLGSKESSPEQKKHKVCYGNHINPQLMFTILYVSFIQGGIISRLFKKSKKKSKSDSIEECSSDEGDEQVENSDLTASHSLPNIVAALGQFLQFIVY